MYSIKVEQLSRSEEPLPEGSDAPQPREQGAAGRPGSGHDDDSGVGATKLAFSCGNPRVEHIVGVLHLYRQVPSREEAELWSHRLRRPSSKRALPAERDKQVCILAIPGDMSFGDFCTWSRSHFEHMRLIQLVRREDTDQALCAVLLTFGTQEAADEFYCESNGEPFTSLEPELICRVVFVREVEFLHCHNAPSAAAPQQQQQQQQQPQQQPLDNAGSGAGLASQKSSSSSQSGSTHQGTAAALLPPPGLTELPTCPVCLERLDHHISGVVTTVCNHKFHNECLQQWGDTSCPVCRYSMQPASTSTCDSCGATSDLWICLICGHVGCGRYNRGDARDHFRQTQHCYALEVLSGRVWDYVGDGYVHRLVQSHVDGKLVEVEPPATSSAAARRLACSDDEEGGGAESELATALRESKIDAVVMEYSHLLVVQLESQRKWWEGQLETQREESEGQSKALQVSLDRAHEQLKEVRQELAGSQKVRQQLQEKLKESQGDALRLGKEVADLQALHEQVVANQSAYVDQLKQAQAQAEERGHTIKDLEEQLRDLMFFIEAQRVAAETGSEIQGGSVLPLQDSPGSSGRAGRRGRGRKSK